MAIGETAPYNEHRFRANGIFWKMQSVTSKHIKSANLEATTALGKTKTYQGLRVKKHYVLDTFHKVSWVISLDPLFTICLTKLTKYLLCDKAFGSVEVTDQNETYFFAFSWKTTGTVVSRSAPQLTYSVHWRPTCRHRDCHHVSSDP
jgi:hypothetical protein